MDNGDHADLIDRVARQMSAVAPSAELTARISQRLDAVPQARLGAWLVWRTAVGALVGAAAIGVFVMSRTPEPTFPQASAPVVAALPPIVMPLPAEAPSGPVRVVKRSPTTATLPSVQELAWMERRIPAFDRVEALTMKRIEVEGIRTPSRSLH